MNTVDAEVTINCQDFMTLKEPPKKAHAQLHLSSVANICFTKDVRPTVILLICPSYIDLKKRKAICRKRVKKNNHSCIPNVMFQASVVHENYKRRYKATKLSGVYLVSCLLLLRGYLFSSKMSLIKLKLQENDTWLLTPTYQIMKTAFVASYWLSSKHVNGYVQIRGIDTNA